MSQVGGELSRAAAPKELSASDRVVSCMDVAAITQLKFHAIEAIASAERCRELAERKPALRDFYHALAFTYERMAREANLMIDKVDGFRSITSEAA